MKNEDKLPAHAQTKLRDMRVDAALRYIESIAPKTDVMSWAIAKGLRDERDSFNDPYFVGSSITIGWGQISAVIDSRPNTPIAPSRTKKRRSRRRPLQLTYEELAEWIGDLRAGTSA